MNVCNMQCSHEAVGGNVEPVSKKASIHRGKEWIVTLEQWQICHLIIIKRSMPWCGHINTENQQMYKKKNKWGCCWCLSTNHRHSSWLCCIFSYDFGFNTTLSSSGVGFISSFSIAETFTRNQEHRGNLYFWVVFLPWPRGPKVQPSEQAATVLNCPNALCAFSRRQLLFAFTFTIGERLFFKMDKRAGQSDRGWLRRNCDSQMTKFTEGYQHGWLTVGHTAKQDRQKLNKKLKGLIKITKVSPIGITKAVPEEPLSPCREAPGRVPRTPCMVSWFSSMSSAHISDIFWYGSP